MTYYIVEIQKNMLKELKKIVIINLTILAFEDSGIDTSVRNSKE
jgi:hypothetical protein